MKPRLLTSVVLAGLIGCASTLDPSEAVDKVGSSEVPAAAAPTTSTQSSSSSSSETLGAPIKAQPGTIDASVVDEAGAPADAGAEESGNAPVVVPPAAYLLSGTMPLRGVHLAGAEFGAPLPGVEGYDYEWPTNDEIDYFVGKGMNTFRVGFMWERLQATAYGGFEAPYFAKLDGLVRYGTSKGAYIVLDPHNFARYYDDVIGSAECPNAVFADFWRRLAVTYRHNPHVVFDLVNEPHDLPTEQWVDAANDAIAAIRAAGAHNLIEVPGNSWAGAYTWDDDDYGTPNSVAMLDIVDPENNFVYEAHQYLDSDGGGEYYTCVSKTVGTDRLQPFLGWLRENHKKGVLGEFAGGRNKTCNAAITDMMTTIDSSSDILVGWTWWAAGPAWDSDYQFSIEPSSGGKDAAQMSLLAPHLGP